MTLISFHSLYLDHVNGTLIFLSFQGWFVHRRFDLLAAFGSAGDDLQVCLVEIDVRIGSDVVERRRQAVLLHRQDDLDQSRGARSGFEVAEVGLGGSEQSQADQHIVKGAIR